MPCHEQYMQKFHPISKLDIGCSARARATRAGHTSLLINLMWNRAVDFTNVHWTSRQKSDKHHSGDISLLHFISHDAITLCVLCTSLEFLLECIYVPCPVKRKSITYLIPDRLQVVDTYIHPTYAIHIRVHTSLTNHNGNALAVDIEFNAKNMQSVKITLLNKYH